MNENMFARCNHVTKRPFKIGAECQVCLYQDKISLPRAPNSINERKETPASCELLFTKKIYTSTKVFEK